MTIKDLEVAVEKELYEKHLWYEGVSVRRLVSFHDHKQYIVRVDGLRGDWKHDHLFADILVEDKIKATLKDTLISEIVPCEETTKSDGSDYYTSDHLYFIRTKEELA